MNTRVLFSLMTLFMVLFGTNTYALNFKDSYTTSFNVIDDNINFSQPTMETEKDYIFLRVDEVNMYMREWSKPMLPVFSKTYELPLGAKINKVECTPQSISQEIIPKKVKPATTVWYIPAINGKPVNPYGLTQLKPGDVVVMDAAGGGGYGDSLDRDPKLVEADVAEGYVSLKSAEEDYGVVINSDTMKEKVDATQRLRMSLKKANG